MPNLRRALVGAAMLAAGSAFDAAQAASLYEALATAYTTNPTLAAARAELRATDEGVPQVLSEWRPTVLGTAQGGHEWDNQNKPLPLNEETNPRSYGVTVRQPIFDGFGTVAGTSQAENLVRAGRAQLTITEQNVLLNAVTAYMNVVRDAAVLELNLNNEKVLQAQLEATEARYEVGELTRTDVAQAEARLQGAVAARIQAEGQLTASRAIYRQVVGEDPADVKMPEERLELPSNRDESVVLSRGAPAVRSAEFQERAAKDDIDVQFSDMLPTVAIEGSWQRQQDIGQREGETDVGSIIGQVTIPLYQAGAPDSRVRQSKQRYMQSRRLTDEAIRAAEQEAVNAWTALQTVMAQARSFEEQVRANEIALEGVRQEQEVGARTILDVLDAQQELLNAQVNLVSTQTDHVVAEYRLLASGGALTAQNLGLNVEYYDPTRHYDKVRNKFIGTGPGVE
ncbi:TolC family outer membrane protein [Dongia deserti]|uniref:TolC family outer membrane protein n=1 Tax=Dongia deserti TaxID=2268030 RepID=UPI000E652284|nr:TolC family outer membrane protein [Dongia deserti]